MKTLALPMTLSLAVLATQAAAAQDQADPMASCPMHAQHMKADGSAAHGKDVDRRHDMLGMAHGESTHSFRLFADGGAIELRANDAGDRKTIDAIRAHLQEVAKQFDHADFSTPAFVHGYAPDGVDAMKRLRADIAYRYDELATGGRIRITTKTADARAAIHDFLRFQVTEHRTANSGQIEEDK